MSCIVLDRQLARRLACAALAAAAMVACAAPTGQAAVAESARSFVAALYDGYKLPGGPEPLGARAGEIFAPTLLALIHQEQADAQGEAGALDYDPICACQDFDISHVAITLAAVTSSAARAEVRFDNSAEHQAVRLDLARVNGQWRVADVHDERVASLVAYLRKAHAQAATASAPR